MPDPTLTEVVARMEALAADVAALVAADTRPVRLIHAHELDGGAEQEIRWYRPAGGRDEHRSWSDWHRIVGVGKSSLGQAWLYLVGPGVNVHRDEPLEVRPVMDLQTGEWLGAA